MSTESDPPTVRKIAPQYDGRGNPQWQSRMTAPDNSFARALMVPDRIIPVIFVPGVMGSNLKGTGAAKAMRWRLDSSTTMLPWFGMSPERRKRILTPDTMTVDDDGLLPQGTRQTQEELRRRKWGEVGAISYAEILVWLENALSDFEAPHDGERASLLKADLNALVGEARLTNDEVGLSYRYRFPVHACGYNWLADNALSSRRLADRIDEIRERYKSDHLLCDKVILVTHSMGGMVARHCSEVLNYKDKILGIVHGVMPTIGAAAVYRRLKAGADGPWAPSMVLGHDAAAMTASLAASPGPLQLLPTAEYGNGWLKIVDAKQSFSFPDNGDPYGQIYAVRSKWWSMCEQDLINPSNQETRLEKRQAQLDRDWADYAKMIKAQIKDFHVQTAGKFHPVTYAFCGSGKDDKSMSYGTVTWTGGPVGVGGLLSLNRSMDVLDARPLQPSELSDDKDEQQPELGMGRTVEAKFSDGGFLSEVQQHFRLSDPDEAGDGTVPLRSGVSPKSHCTAFAEATVRHEPAYKLSESEENRRVCRFALRAIVQIAQGVQKTSLKY